MSQFAFVGLDEAGIIKSFTGQFRNDIIERCISTPYKQEGSATPSPNDYMELGNHAEFLGVMTRAEMLATFFTHDGGDTSKWRLKRHAEGIFWRWVASWAVYIRKPSDIGYSNEGYDLPSLNIFHHVVEAEHDVASTGTMFAIEARTMPERRAARKNSLDGRIQAIADLVNASDEQWVIWCHLNPEGDALEKAIPGSVQVSGSNTDEFKNQAILDFTSGKIQKLITKSSIFGWGMNLQCCHNTALFFSDSFEEYYQVVRRFWRFGQTKEVNCHVVTAHTEGAVVRNIQRKEKDANIMADAMLEHMKDAMEQQIHGQVRDVAEYRRDVARGNGWELHLGDCVEVFREIPDDTVGYTIYSPPFASLYTYNNSDRDMGNVKSDAEFSEHFKFLVPELLRVTMPGRLMSFHCMNLPTSKERDGVIGIRDFRGELIRMFKDAGWIFHSEVCIWKDPVTAMQRTKALGLLHKQLVKDSAMSRQGIPDYLVTMRKPGDNPERVAGRLEEFVGDDPRFNPNGLDDTRRSIEIWQRYASPVWTDIRQSRTLNNYRDGRDEQDERHVCPLQLDVIERGIQLWSNPGDLVATPFAGIGSELYCAVKMGRRAVGAELKPSYWEVARRNCEDAEGMANTPSLLDLMAEPDELEAVA